MRWAGSTALLLAFSTLAEGEPAVTIRSNGAPANRVDLAILGDGYTTAQLPGYASAVETIVAGLFAGTPFSGYQNYFNVHRVDVTSAQAGVDHPERNVYKDTALGAYYNCGGIQRTICVNVSKVYDVLTASLQPDEYDIILVIVNDVEYGGSGGAVAVTSVHSDSIEITLHELGHSFGLLADEYAGGGPACNPLIEPFEINATRETQRAFLKWNHWVSPSTPIPTFTSQPAVPGLFQGARYCFSGLYRPTFDSKMRTLGKPWDQINNEQLVKRIYNWVTPLDSRSPSETDVVVTGAKLFQVSTPAPLTHALRVDWALDGTPFGQGPWVVLAPEDLLVGVHLLEAAIADPTPWVRSDPAGALTETTSWNVELPNTPPYTPSDPEPWDGIQGVCTTGTTLSWTGGDANPEHSVLYDLYFGDSSPPPLEAADLGMASYGLPSLTNATKYYWNVVATDDVDDSTTGPIWTFTTTGGACAYSLSYTVADFGSVGGSDDVIVFASCGCGWTATSNDPWITIESAPNGFENEPVTFSVAPNPLGLHRTGTVTLGGQTLTVHQNRAVNTSFHTVDPCRMADTRGRDGSLGGPALVAGVDRNFKIAGTCGIPPTATAISANIAVVGSTAPGNLRLHAAGTPVPPVSTINYAAGQTRSNNAVAPLSPSGRLAVFVAQSSGSVHFVLDVNGYFEEHP